MSLRGCCTQLDPDSINTFYINGTSPVAGTIFTNPVLAHTFRLIQQNGRNVFYKGEIARAIVAQARATRSASEARRIGWPGKLNE